MEWSRLEVEATVADYFHMLVMELSGQSYKKSSHRKELLKRLNARSDGAVERKHQNISAILIENGYPYISGYKPLSNYQELLRQIVEERLAQDIDVGRAADVACVIPAAPPLLTDYAGVLVDAPVRDHSVKEPRESEYSAPKPVKRDYLAREARNASLGEAGELFVVNFEHHRLISLGLNKFADRVEHVAKTQGDGLGFDVLSFDASGRERFIEVKTTSFGKETPFYATKGEVRFAQQHERDYVLYRLFNFRRNPRLFELAGRIDRHCSMEPTTYLCRFS